MDCDIYCLVDASGHVYVKDGAVSHSEVAANFGLDAHVCDTYRFDLAARRLLVDRGKPASDRAAQAYWDRHVGTPDKLMVFAAEGRLTKQVLGSLLGADDRLAYRETCAVIEKQYTDDCAAKNDPCLEEGCAVEGEICLEPLLRAGPEFHRACGAAWKTCSRILDIGPRPGCTDWIEDELLPGSGSPAFPFMHAVETFHVRPALPGRLKALEALAYDLPLSPFAHLSLF